MSHCNLQFLKIKSSVIQLVPEMSEWDVKTSHLAFLVTYNT